MQELILKCFEREGDTESGVDIRKIVQTLMPNGISESQVRTAMAFLADEGHVYSTIDEDHFKSTAM